MGLQVLVSYRTRTVRVRVLYLTSGPNISELDVECRPEER